MLMCRRIAVEQIDFRLPYLARHQRSREMARRVWRATQDPRSAPHRDLRGSIAENQVSALGTPSIILDFVLSCRCQGVGNSLQPGGVMLIGHPPLS